MAIDALSSRYVFPGRRRLTYMVLCCAAPSCTTSSGTGTTAHRRGACCIPSSLYHALTSRHPRGATSTPRWPPTIILEIVPECSLLFSPPPPPSKEVWLRCLVGGLEVRPSVLWAIEIRASWLALWCLQVSVIRRGRLFSSWVARPHFLGPSL